MPDSYFEHTNTPTGTSFTFPFRFITVTDVHVLAQDPNTMVWADLDNLAEVTANTNNLGGTVTLQSGWNDALTYERIRIYRATSTIQLVDFENGARLTSTDLDNAYQQSLYIAQEISEDASTVQFSFQRTLAETSLVGISNFNTQSITSTATQNTTFDLTFTPATESSLAFLVSIDGAVQAPDDYTILKGAPSTITFASAVPTDSVITILTLATSAIAASVDNTTTEINSANSVQVKDGGITPEKLSCNPHATNRSVIQWDATSGNVRIGEGVTTSNIWKDVDLRGVISIGARGTDSNFGFIHQDPNGEGICLTGANHRIGTAPDLTVLESGYVVLGKVPTYATGLATGTIYKDSNGFLKIK